MSIPSESVLPTGPAVGITAVGWIPTLDGKMALLFCNPMDGDVPMAGVGGPVVLRGAVEKIRITAGKKELVLLEIGAPAAAMLLPKNTSKQLEVIGSAALRMTKLLFSAANTARRIAKPRLMAMLEA